MADDLSLRQRGNREKRVVALFSVLAAVFLTLLKLIVGLLTGSLGILSEAAHSGLDLVAAAVTFLAVRVSSRPADREHTYGHGKVENLSALFETVLLLITCVWIIYEALQRLFFKSVEVEASFAGFAVMGITIVVDTAIARALAKTGKQYNSQALEADALHFSTDVWSAWVVIGGLGLVFLSELWGVTWLAKADALAALGVAAIVVYVSLQLGKRTIEGLLDAVPAKLLDEVAWAARVVGVEEVKRVRVRRSGPETFADITLTVSRDLTFEVAHEIASRAEEAVHQLLPGADVMVHVEPVRSQDEGFLDQIRRLAARQGLNIHGVRLYDVLGQRSLELHLEVDDSLRVDEAHAQATTFEETVRQSLPAIHQIVTHIEPVGDGVAMRQATATDEGQILQLLHSLCEEKGLPCYPHKVTTHRIAGELSLSFHCHTDPNTSIRDAHALTEQVEQELRSRVPNLGRVVIHIEPPDAG